MILYVLRHAEAVAGSDALQDQWRYLTEKGRASVKKTSSAIAKFGPKTRLTVTSPLTRAVQTAEIAAEQACRKNVVVASTLLLPGADVHDLGTYLRGVRDSKQVMVVGHEPQLGLLVAALLGRSQEAVSLNKGACVALKLDPGPDEKPAGFLWYLTPGKKRVTSFEKAFPQKVS
ncbi:MAG: histidine phosphatase family protein [Desulfuromonadaceae bacterium]|nr:histidine phosphatase family protein [Desulfuromonadaceae bacterium]